VGHFCPPGSGSGSRDPVESGSTTPWIVIYSAYLSFSPCMYREIYRFLAALPAPNFHIPCSVTWSDRAGNVWVVISWHWAAPATDSIYQRGFHIGRVQSCVMRLPKYWPPTPFSTRRVCPPPATKAVHTRVAERGGGGGSIFWKTKDIGLASYSNNLFTVSIHSPLIVLISLLWISWHTGSIPEGL
jgi:hypothetical protein